MPELDWDDVIIPRELPIGLMTWVTDEPYLYCGLCDKALVGATDDYRVYAETLGDLVDIVTAHARAKHGG